MKRVLVLQHAEPEGLGLIAQALALAGAGHTSIRADLGAALPDRLDGYHGLIALGGPQSAYDDSTFPFLKAEKELIRSALSDGIPVLGVCLGSQLIADVLGARVWRGAGVELGWHNVSVAPGAAQDWVTAALPREITALHWHGDCFDLPHGAESLGSSRMTEVQGFVWRNQVYALLFHLETTFDQLAAMTAAFPQDLEAARVTERDVLGEAPERLSLLRPVGMQLFERWARRVIVPPPAAAPPAGG